MDTKNFDRSELIRAALDCIGNSYAPYSGFNVAAAVLAGSGAVYTGVNVENASYPAGICAERTAISRAVSCGEREIAAVAVVGGRGGIPGTFCPPCGICRQVMREFCDPEKLKVIIAVSPEEYRELTLAELLPESCGTAAPT